MGRCQNYGEVDIVGKYKYFNFERRNKKQNSSIF